MTWNEKQRLGRCSDVWRSVEVLREGAAYVDALKALKLRANDETQRGQDLVPVTMRQRECTRRGESELLLMARTILPNRVTRQS